MHFYLDIQKAEQRIVEGIASTDTIDDQPGTLDGQAYVGDIVDTGAIEGALADYLKWANVREMHQNSAVGTAITAKVVDGQLRLAVHVVDDSAWDKVKARVYKGFSIGGRALKSRLEQLPDGRYVRRILKMVLTEISLVDRPANPEARILVFKGADMAVQDEQETSDAITQVRQLANSKVKKAAADPVKIVGMIQQARNDLELAGDMDGAALMTQAIALIQQATGEADEGSPAEEASESPAEGDTADPSQMAMAARAKLRKGGRVFAADKVSAMHNVVKTLLGLLAGAGDPIAQKAMGAYTKDGSGEDIDMAAKLAAAVLPQFETLAKGLLVIHDRLSTVEAQPAPGGPVIRSVQKVIAGQPPSTPVTKPQASGHIREALDDLLRKANTAPSVAMREQYMKQHAQLRDQYA
jgi:phage head maturation protease